MAKVVVLSCCQGSIAFQRKFLWLKEGESITLGRANWRNPALKTNGYFEYPSVGRPFLSRKHAEISRKENEVFLVSLNKNTFIGEERLIHHVPTKIENSSTLVFGGYLSEDLTALAEGSVVCSVCIFDESSEDFKYFSQVERDFPFYCQWPGPSPPVTIRLEVLYSILIDRLEVLKTLSVLNESELDSPICDRTDVADGEKLESYLKSLSGDVKDYKALYKARQNDSVSQCALAVACCRNFRTRNWFIAQERKLFILRWLRMLPHEQLAFLYMMKADYTEVFDDELNKLALMHPGFLTTSIKYFKIPFTEAPSFVARRRVCLIDGYCYISLRDMHVPLVKKLRTSLWDSTKVARSNLHKIWFEERIRSIIHFVEQHICDPDRYKRRTVFGEKVTEHNVHKLCDESFPLCMKILHHHLCRDHHLRNGGRFQYTLFLKGIGLSMSGSLCFWKAYFTKKMEETVFMKRYSYHIRHAYGVEGKMADYPPQNCADILKAAPGPLEYHGCPFRVLDEIRMKEALYRSGLKKEVYSEILDLVKKGTPQDACKKYFELTQGGAYPHSTVSHPNIYYDESRRLIKFRKGRVRIAVEPSNEAETDTKPPVPSVALTTSEW